MPMNYRKRGEQDEADVLFYEAGAAIKNALLEAPTNEEVARRFKELTDRLGYKYVHADSYRFLPGLLGPQGEDPGY